ncbi:hypothetical protein [Nostoc sp.]|uniref:hypothetical protein n=1 Tax=Nostoc sp. TaxID=1180 RepID=UPI002FF47DA4
MAKVIRGGKIHTWNPHKHPRGNKGRFAETPDAPSTTGRRSSGTRGKSVTREKGLTFERGAKRSPLTRAEVIKQSMVLKAAKNAAEVYQARLELYQRLNHDQRRRLQEVLKAKKEAKEVGKPLNERSQEVTTASGETYEVDMTAVDGGH